MPLQPTGLPGPKSGMVPRSRGSSLSASLSPPPEPLSSPVLEPVELAPVELAPVDVAGAPVMSGIEPKPE